MNIVIKKWCKLPKSECPGTVPGESDRPAACQEVDFPHTASSPEAPRWLVLSKRPNGRPAYTPTDQWEWA